MLRLGEPVAARIGHVRGWRGPADRGALCGQGPVGRSFPHGSGSGRGGPRLGARQVGGHAAHRAPAQCLRRGDGNTSGPQAWTVTGSARVCQAYDTVDLGGGIGPETAGIAVRHPPWPAKAGASSIKLEPGAPIGPVDVITVWPNNVLTPASTSTNRPRPPRISQLDLEPCAMTNATVFGTAPALVSCDTRGRTPRCRPHSRARSW